MKKAMTSRAFALNPGVPLSDTHQTFLVHVELEYDGAEQTPSE
jgi:hypothetical protein